jgi:hypothetical protein
MKERLTMQKEFAFYDSLMGRYWTSISLGLKISSRRMRWLPIEMKIN